MELQKAIYHSVPAKRKKILILCDLKHMFIPLILFFSYRTISMAGLASWGACGAESAAATNSSGGSTDSYNGYDARHNLRWWKGTCDL